MGPNFGGMVLRWSPFRIVFDDPGHQPRWLLLLKIENSAKNELKNLLLKLLGQSGPNLGGMVLMWSPFRIVSDDIDHQPRWPPLLKT